MAIKIKEENDQIISGGVYGNSTLNDCKILDCQPGDILGYVGDRTVED